MPHLPPMCAACPALSFGVDTPLDDEREIGGLEVHERVEVAIPRAVPRRELRCVGEVSIVDRRHVDEREPQHPPLEHDELQRRADARPRRLGEAIAPPPVP